MDLINRHSFHSEQFYYGEHLTKCKGNLFLTPCNVTPAISLAAVAPVIAYTDGKALNIANLW